MKKTETQIEPELLEKLILDDELETQGERQEARLQTVARLRLLWEKRGYLRRVALWALAASLLVAFLIPVRYESTARLMPPDDTSGSLAMLGALARSPAGIGGLAGDFLGLKNRGALFVGVLQSRTVQDRLIERFDLADLYWTSRMEDTRQELAGYTSISEDRKSGIIEITVTDKDPTRARDMAQAYVTELNRLVAEVSTSAARRERQFIEQRLKVVKQELDDAAREFSQFASKNTTIDIKEQGRAMVEAAATVQGQLIVAQTELESLKQVYTENNVRVRAARARIAELRDQLEKLGGKDVGAAGADSASSDSLYPSIRKLPLLGVTYADLYRRTKVAEVVFELLTQQHELAKVQEAKEIPSVKVLDRPVVPQKKSFPPRTLIVLLSTGFGLGLACLWVLAEDRWKGTRDDDQAKVLLREVGLSLRGTARGAWQKLSRNGRRPASPEEDATTKPAREEERHAAERTGRDGN